MAQNQTEEKSLILSSEHMEVNTDSDQELDLRLPKKLSQPPSLQPPPSSNGESSPGGSSSRSPPHPLDTAPPNSDSNPAFPALGPPPLPPPVSLPPQFSSPSFKPPTTAHPFHALVPAMNAAAAGLAGAGYLNNLSQREREYLAQRELLLAQQQFLAREALLRSSNGHRYPIGPMGAEMGLPGGPYFGVPPPVGGVGMVPPFPSPEAAPFKEEEDDVEDEEEGSGEDAGEEREEGQRKPIPTLSLTRPAAESNDASKDDSPGAGEREDEEIEEKTSVRSGEERESNGEPVGHQWTFEEQFKQLYELSSDQKRKEFLDDLFSFMQKRGTPVNRIPIMAKQVLDLYELFRLVVSKGGLVEVINKKLWREITKGLNLPSSITSAAFTLRTQYMKYLYPYECEKLKLSTPAELQVAIDGNRREARRPSYSFDYPPVNGQLLAPPVSLTGPPTGLFPPPPLLSQRGPAMNTYLKPGFPMRHSGELNLSKDGCRGSPEDRDSVSTVVHHGPGLDDFRAITTSSSMDPAKVAAAAAAVCNGAMGLTCDVMSPPAPKRLALDASVAQNGSNGIGEKSLRRSSPLPGPLPTPFPQFPPFPSVPLPGASNVRISTQATSHLPGLPDTALMVSMEINGLNYQGVLFAQPKRY